LFFNKLLQMQRQNATSTEGSPSNPFDTMASFMGAVAQSSHGCASAPGDSSSDLMPNEKGAVHYVNHGPGVLALLCDFNTSLNRDASPQQIVELVRRIMNKIRDLKLEGKRESALQLLIDFVKMTFFQRDPRFGKGERKIFYRLFLLLWQQYPQTASGLLPLLVENGCIKDFFLLWETAQEQDVDYDGSLFRAIIKVIVEITKTDLKKITTTVGDRAVEGDRVLLPGMRLTLMVKWLPREGKHFDKTCLMPIYTSDGGVVQVSLTSYLAGQFLGVSDQDLLQNYGVHLKRSGRTSKQQKRHNYMMCQYRKMISDLEEAFENSQGCIPETLMCSGQWSKLEIQKIPGKCRQNNLKALLNQTKKGEQRSELPDRILCAQKIEKQLAEGKLGDLNVKGLFPHELLAKFATATSQIEKDILTEGWLSLEKLVARKIAVYKLSQHLKSKGVDLMITDEMLPELDVIESKDGLGLDPLIQCLRKNGVDASVVSDEMLRDLDLMTLGHTDGIAISDVSGSMGGLPMEVSVALGVMWARLASGSFKNKIITFSDTPQIVDLNGMSVSEMFKKVRSMDWGGSTDFEATMKLLVDLCKLSGVPTSMIPKLKLIVFTDGQFDQMVSGALPAYNYKLCKTVGGWTTQFEHIQRMWIDAGYDAVPQILFWNLRSAPGALVQSRQMGVMELSGWSANSMDVAMLGADVAETVVVNADGTLTKVSVANITPEDAIKEILSKHELDQIALMCYSLLKENGEFGLGQFPCLPSFETALEEQRQATLSATQKIPASTSEATPEATPEATSETTSETITMTLTDWSEAVVSDWTEASPAVSAPSNDDDFEMI